MRRLFWIAATLVLAACNLQEEPPVTYVVITDTPAADVTIAPQAAPPTQTPPPLPSPTATPDIAPDQALTQADVLAHDGYWDDARDLYLIAFQRSDAQPFQRIRAAQGYAILALRDGAFDLALNLLTRAIDLAPDSAETGQAYFLRGEANLGLARWTSAINDYRNYLRVRPGLIDSYVHERIADAFLALNMTEDALGSYASAAASERARAQQAALLERAARIALTAGQPRRAADYYIQILTTATNRPYRAQIELAAAQALEAAGDANGAAVRYKTVFDTYPDSPQALTAMTTLARIGVALSGYERGRVYSLNGDYARAVDALNEFTTSVPLQEITPDLYLLLGRAYREIGNPTAALTAFRTIVEQYPTNSLFGEALLETGRTRYLSGDTAEAIRTYLSIAETYANLQSVAADAMWRAGFLYNEQEQYAEAVDILLQLAGRYPASEQAVTGLEIAANAAANLGDAGRAEAIWSQLAQVATGDLKARAALQLARLATLRGDTEAARAAYALVIQAAPDSNSATRARDYLNGSRPFAPPATLTFAFDENADRQTAEAWIRTTFTLAADVPLGGLPDMVTADPRWRRGAELLALGLIRSAEDELLSLLDSLETNPIALYGLALEFRALGLYYPSQQAAADLITLAKAGTLEAPPLIGRLRFPAPYIDVLLGAAQRHNADPLLLLSLIRNESLFDTFATAAAGEKGLTQVIPGTADYIAGLLDWPNYDHSDLFQPQAGIEFGAVYLGEQLARFDGVAMIALAAYNAGPGRGIAWREAGGQDDYDAFLNAITISSTRGYVERIATFYATYRALYGTP